jgi:hypothetical protein
MFHWVSLLQRFLSCWIERGMNFCRGRTLRQRGGRGSGGQANNGGSCHAANRRLRVLQQGLQVWNLVAMATGAEGLSCGRTNYPVLVVESIL